MQKKTSAPFTPAQIQVMANCRDSLDRAHITPQDFAAHYRGEVNALPFNVLTIIRLIGLSALVAGYFALLGMQWDGMSHLWRLTLTLGPAISCFISAALWQKRTVQPDTLPFVLLLIAAAGLGTHGISEWADHFFGNSATGQFLGYAVITLPLLALFRARPFAATLFAVWFWLNTALVSLAEWGAAPQFMVLSLLAVANALWGLSMTHAGFRRLSILPDIVTLIATTMLIWDQVGDLTGWNSLLLLYGIGLLVLGMKTHRRLLLLWGAVQLFGSIVKYADFYFAGQISWPILIMIIGAGTLALTMILNRFWHTKRT